MNFRTHKNLPQVQVLNLYNSVGWTRYTAAPDQLQRAIEYSLSVLSAWEADQLVGLLRAVGDGESILYIQDLLVLPSHQRKGVGRNLMDITLNAYPYIQQVVLLTDIDPVSRAFYENVGLQECQVAGLNAFVLIRSAT